jgi:hypothetical protein
LCGGVIHTLVALQQLSPRAICTRENELTHQDDCVWHCQSGEAHRYSNVGGQGRVGSVLRLTALTLLYVNKRFSMRKRQSILRDGAMTLAVMLIITAILIGLCIWYGPSSG